jgi:tripartite-type tricarboxylate transporter receptor subunit TctC
MMAFARVFQVVAVGLAVVVGSDIAAAQSYPSRPIRIVVPTAPGGPLDLVVRALGEKLAVSLKQPVVVENKPGAAGNIGAELVAKSAPDGHVLLAALGTTFTVNPHVYATMPVDVINDLRPIANMAESSLMLVVHPSLPVNSLAELVALAKREPMSYAHAGHGSPGHLAMEYFKLKAGITNLTPVPYRGNAPLVTDLVGGQVKVAFVSTPGVMPHVLAGRLRGFVVSSKGRSSLAPDIPAISEAGYPGFEYVAYFFLHAPSAIPAPIADMLEREVRTILTSDAMKVRFAPHDIRFLASTGVEAPATIKSESALWAEIVKATNMKAE